MTERYEEMNRMREHVMNEVDKNKDKMISLEEFLESTKSEEFKKDEGWKVQASTQLYLLSEVIFKMLLSLEFIFKCLNGVICISYLCQGFRHGSYLSPSIFKKQASQVKGHLDGRLSDGFIALSYLISTLPYAE